MRHSRTTAVAALALVTAGCGSGFSDVNVLVSAVLSVSVPARVDAARIAGSQNAFEAVVPLEIRETGGVSARVTYVSVSVPSALGDFGTMSNLGQENLDSSKDHVPANGTVTIRIRVYTGEMTSGTRTWPCDVRVHARDERGRSMTPTAAFQLVAPQ